MQEEHKKVMAYVMLTSPAQAFGQRTAIQAPFLSAKLHPG